MSWTSLDDYEFEANAINEVTISRLSDTLMMVAYQRDPGGPPPYSQYGVVLNWDGSNITETITETSLTTSGDNLDMAGLGDGASTIFIYRFGGYVQGQILQRSGSSLNIGAETQLSIDGTNNPGRVAALSSTKAIIVYGDTGGLHGQVLTINTLTQTITQNTPVLIDASASYNNSTLFGVASLDSDSALVVYAKSSTGRARVLTISGTSITVGSEITFESGNCSQIRVDSLTAAKAVVGYSDVSNNSYPTVCILNISGATVTAETPIVVVETSASGEIRITSQNDKWACIVYGLTIETALQLLNITSSPLTLEGSPFTFSTNTGQFDVDALIFNEIMMTYRNDDTADEGKAQILSNDATEPFARFYHGLGVLQEKFTLPFEAVNPGAMTLNKSLGTVVIGGDRPALDIVVYSQHPYPTGTAMSPSIPTGTAVISLKWI